MRTSALALMASYFMAPIQAPATFMVFSKICYILNGILGKNSQIAFQSSSKSLLLKSTAVFQRRRNTSAWYLSFRLISREAPRLATFRDCSIADWVKCLKVQLSSTQKVLGMFLSSAIAEQNKVMMRSQRQR